MIELPNLALVLILIIALIAVLAWLIWWLFIETEGVYLGRRVVVWLYDIYAERYESIKKFNPEWESRALARPLLDSLPQHPTILDVATGTGRLPRALHAEADFDGQIIGIDASRDMLKVATRQDHSHLFIQAHGDCLPVPRERFDCVTCLEALEFMPDASAVLAECWRALKPGGLLLITNRKGIRLMPGKVISTRQRCERLAATGWVDVRAELWQVDYDQIWARKATRG
jgi:SAM-dependent methyltransferase